MKLLNGGSQSTSLLSYHVDDSAGHVYEVPQWTGPAIQLNSPLNVTFTIDGKDFTFQSNNSYAVTVHDSQNDDWTFSFSL